MVSASAFWNARAQRFDIPQATSLSEVDLALDSAGFTAVKLWQSKGKQAGMAGVYPWTCAQYLELVSELGVSWWSAPDLCCEPSVAPHADEVTWRVRATATLLEHTLRTLRSWHLQLGAQGWSPSMLANTLPPPVPILQGWTAQDYLHSLNLTMQVWQRWQPWLAAPALIGVGSVCRRDIHHPTHGLLAILRAIHPHLPAGARLHLFGVKGPLLSQLRDLPWIASVDSMAFDFSARMNARKAARSNTMEGRCQEMSRWMGAARARSASTQTALF